MRASGEGRAAAVRQLGRYVLVGGLGTGLNAGLFLLLRTGWEVLPATLSALVLSTLVSTEANRRFTFAAARPARWRMHLQTTGTIAFYAGYSSLVLAVLGTLVTAPTPALQSRRASVLGGIGRYLLLRHWVFDLPQRPATRRGTVIGWHSPGSASVRPASDRRRDRRHGPAAELGRRLRPGR